MRRRQFLGLTPAVAGLLLSRNGFSQPRPCPPGQAGVSGGSSVATVCGADQIQDWLLRSQGPGVQWAHNFEQDWEVDQFRYPDSATTFANAPDSSKSSWVSSERFWTYQVYSAGVRRVAGDGFAGGGCVEVGPVQMGTTITSSLPASTGDMTVTVTEAPVAPYNSSLSQNTWTPPDGTYRAVACLYESPSKFELVDILPATVAGSTTLTIRRAQAKEGVATTAQAWNPGATIIWPTHSGYNWWRPFSALRYADTSMQSVTPAGSSVAAQDKGYASSRIVGLTYSPTRANGGVKGADWRWGFYAHPDYGDAANSEPVPCENPTWDAYDIFRPRNATGGTTGTTYPTREGDEFWLQFRVKTTANRYLLWNTVEKQKYFWFTTRDNRNPRTYGGGEFVHQIRYDGFLDFYQHGTPAYYWGYAPAGDSLYDPPFPLAPYNNVKQSGYEGAGTGRGLTCSYQRARDLRGAALSPYCFMIPAETWVTILVHIKPGHRSADRTFARLAAPLAADGSTTITVDSAAALPRIVKGSDPLVHTNSYYITLVRVSDGVKERVKVTGESGNRLTIVRAATRQAFGVNDLVRIAGEDGNYDQLTAFKDAYPNDWTYTLKANRPGIDPPGEYVTVIDGDWFAFEFADTYPGLHIFQWNAYSNNHGSFLPWGFRLAQAILSKQPIPCPRS